MLESLSPDAIESMDSAFVKHYNECVGKNARLKNPESFLLQEELGALCYDGDPEAPVVYLQANPSYGVGSTRETHYQPNKDYPLSVAGPHIYPPTRDYYHGQVFRHLREEGVSLEEIGQKLLKVELCPWASKNWPSNARLLNQLSLFPSREPTLTFVQHLVDRGALFIIARAWNPWFKALPDLERLTNTRVFKSRTPAGSLICEGFYPEGWDKLLKAFRTEKS